MDSINLICLNIVREGIIQKRRYQGRWWGL